MPDTFRDTLLRQITSLQQQIATLEEKLAASKAALCAYDQHSGVGGVAEQPEDASVARFAGVRPFDAIVRVLAEHGGRMDRDALMKVLVDGGATAGKKRGLHNLRISIDVNENLGKLIVDGNTVSLPKP